MKIAALKPVQSPAPACKACAPGGIELAPFSMAFQPIVDVAKQTVFAYEALVRGPNGEPAVSVLSTLNAENRYLFDQTARVRSIELAAKLGLHHTGAKLSINFMPGAVYSPAACIRKTLQTASEVGFPLHSLIFEITEDERIEDVPHIQAIVTEYRRHGFAIALDDYGAAYSGPGLFLQIDTDIIKLDQTITLNLHQRPRAQVYIRYFAALCRELGVQLIGEGIETPAEYEALRNCGVHLMQGYFFARPAFEHLPAIHWPTQTAAA